MSESIRFPARDGRLLAGTLHPAERPRGTVAIASAMGVPRRHYARFASYLAEQGLSTLTFDYRGIGDSLDGRLRHVDAQLHDWGELDLAGAFDFLRGRHPALPLQLVTHSVGGQVFGLIPDAPVAGAIFVASQSGSWRLWNGLGRAGMFALWNAVLPAMACTLGYVPMKAFGQGEDIPAGVGLEWARWGRQRDYIWSYARARGGLGFIRYGGPLTAYAIADDVYAPLPGVQALLEMYQRARRELRVLQPHSLGVKRIGHFGVFREQLREKLWPELGRTLLQRAA